MARSKRRGPAARNRARNNGDLDANQGSPTKKGLKQSTNTSPRKGRKAQQQDTIDEGVAATPDDTTQIQDDDSTYASSPLNETSQNSPSATPARKNAARSFRSNNKFDDLTLRSLGAEQASSTQAVPYLNPQSKVVVLKLCAHKLRKIVEAHSAPERRVIFKVPPEQLRSLQQESRRENLESEVAKLTETLQGGQSAEMAPVKEKSPHDVLDGESIFTTRFYQYHSTDHIWGRSFQKRHSESLRCGQHYAWLSTRVT